MAEKSSHYEKSTGAFLDFLMSYIHQEKSLTSEVTHSYLSSCELLNQIMAQQGPDFENTRNKKLALR
jgi:hypothetical protein